jgi:hypothetical protein
LPPPLLARVADADSAAAGAATQNGLTAGWVRRLKRLGTMRAGLILGGVSLLLLVLLIALFYAVYKCRKTRRRRLASSRADPYLSPLPSNGPNSDSEEGRAARYRSEAGSPNRAPGRRRVPEDRAWSPPSQSHRRWCCFGADRCVRKGRESGTTVGFWHLEWVS